MCVSRECIFTPSAAHVPDPNGVVVAARRHSVVFVGKRHHASHAPCMPCQRGDELSRLPPPHFGCRVVAARDQPLAAKHHSSHTIGVGVGDGVREAAAAHIPQLDRPVVAATGQHLPVRAERHAPHSVAMSGERGVALSAADVPQLDALIGARRGHDRIVGRHRHTPDSAGMAPEHPHLDHAVQAPDAHRVIALIAARDGRRAVGEEGDAHHAAGMACKGAQQLACGCTPHFGRAAAAAQHDAHAVGARSDASCSIGMASEHAGESGGEWYVCNGGGDLGRASDARDEGLGVGLGVDCGGELGVEDGAQRVRGGELQQRLFVACGRRDTLLCFHLFPLFVFFFPSRLTQTWRQTESGCVATTTAAAIISIIAWVSSQRQEELAELHSSSEMPDVRAFPVAFDELQPPDALPDVVERDGRGAAETAAAPAKNGPAYACVRACTEEEKWTQAE